MVDKRLKKCGDRSAVEQCLVKAKV